MICKNCQRESRELWAIGPPYPDLLAVLAGNFVILKRCEECNQLWLESFYEPFAAFRYAVKWPKTVKSFEVMSDLDQSTTLCKWHEAQIRVVANGADAKTLEYIQAHYNRASGYVDLRPSNTPNLITLFEA